MNEKDPAEKRIEQLTPEFYLMQLLHSAGEIMISHAPHISELDSRNHKKGKVHFMRNSHRLALKPELGIEWDGTNTSEDEDRKGTPRVERIIFRNITVREGKRGQVGNPAIRYDYNRGETILESGGIDYEFRNEIIEAISNQISLAQEYFGDVDSKETLSPNQTSIQSEAQEPQTRRRFHFPWPKKPTVKQN